MTPPSTPGKGPRSLKVLLTYWRPSPGVQARFTRDDALAQLSVAWAAAVGSGVAARSRPLKFNAGTLVVLTASSAWSDELSLLAPRILEALQKSCPQAGVRQLRFRVASGRSRVLFDALARRRARAKAEAQAAPQDPLDYPHSPVPPTSSQSLAPSREDVQSVLANLRALQARLDEERDRSGWRTCPRCGRRFQVLGADRLCAPCFEAQRRALESRVERALMQAPWIQYSQLVEYVPQTSRQVADRVRRRLLTRWETELNSAQRRLRRGAITPQDRVLAWSYVMLLARLPQRDLGVAVVNDVLGSDWAAALFGEQRNLKQEAARPPQQKQYE